MLEYFIKSVHFKLILIFKHGHLQDLGLEVILVIFNEDKHRNYDDHKGIASPNQQHRNAIRGIICVKALDADDVCTAFRKKINIIYNNISHR